MIKLLKFNKIKIFQNIICRTWNVLMIYKNLIHYLLSSCFENNIIIVQMHIVFLEYLGMKEIISHTLLLKILKS